jgi:hypothetical protein
MTTAIGYDLDATTGITAAATVLREAQSAYDVATSNWRLQRELGGIVPLDPDDEADAFNLSLGVKWKAATPDGAIALMKWQRAFAELTAARVNRHNELRGRLR